VICPSGSHTGDHTCREAAPNPAVVARLDRAIQYAAAYRSIAEASGILDHPHSRVMTVFRVEKGRVLRSLTVIASEAKQSILSFFLRRDGLLRCALNDEWIE
jgi:hypothetical protein